MRTGSRIAIPAEGTKVCASCGVARGNVRKDWSPIDRDGHVVAYTCPRCPRADEPIRLIRRQSGDRFRAVVDVTSKGQPRRQEQQTFADLDGARAWVDETRAEVAGGTYAETVESTVVTVARLCDRWLSSRRDVRQVTREGYRTVLSPVYRLLGDRDVTTVTSSDLDQLVDWMTLEGGTPRKEGQPGRPLGPVSVRQALGRLSQAFDLAVRDNLVPSNPVKQVRRPRKRRRVGEDLEHWPTVGTGPAARCPQMEAFRAAADADRLAGAWRLTLCGLTRADAMGLRWSDVDLDAGVVRIQQGRVALDAGDATDEPKSAQRRRRVPVETIHPGTMALLRQLRARQAADRLAAGAGWHDSGYVVVDEVGRPLRPEVYSDRFRKLCAAAGVPAIKLHSVRHSLAQWMIALGVPPDAAAALLGHTTEVFLSTYLPEAGAAGIGHAAAALGQAMSA